LKKMEVILKSDLTHVSQRIDEMSKDKNVPRSHIVIDEVGVGGGVVDNLKGVNGFIGNSSALENPLSEEKENYRNLKTQCHYMLADRVNNRRISIKCDNMVIQDEITEELEQIKSLDMDKDGPLQMIRKEDVKELLGRSPDYSDMLAMRMYFFLKKVDKVKSWQYSPNYNK